MKKLRVNMCFNETDNPDVMHLIEESGTKRPSGLIHDLVRKGLILESLIAGRLIPNVTGTQSESRGNAPHSEAATRPESKPASAKPKPKPKPNVDAPPMVEQAPAVIQAVATETAAPAEPTYNPNCLGDLGMDL